MTESNREDVLRDLEARRLRTVNADREFRRIVDTSSDAEAILAAARQMLDARGELRAIELAKGELEGAAGLNEARRRFDGPSYAGYAPANLHEGDDGYAGIAEAAKRFGTN